MKKENIQIIIGIAGLGLAVLALSPKGGASDSGYGGYFPIPEVQGAGTPEAVVVSGSPAGSSFQISDKILAAMAGDTKKVAYSSVPADIPQLGISWTGTNYTAIPGSSSQLHGKLLTDSLGFGFDAATNKYTAVAGSSSQLHSTTKKEVAVTTYANTMGGSSSNRGGTWSGSSFSRGRYR